MKLGLGADSVMGLLWLPGELAELRQSHCYPLLGAAPPAKPGPNLDSAAGGGHREARGQVLNTDVGSRQSLLFAAGAPGVC